MQVTLENTSGALQIAISISVFLFGIVTMQTHRYYHTFQDDRLIFKFLVALLWWAKITFLIDAYLITTHTSRVLEFGQSVAVSYEVYKQTTSTVIVTRFAGLGTALLLGGLITTLVQTFFALRVFKLLPKPFSYIGIFCAMLAICRCIGSFVLGHAAVLTHNVIVWRTQWKWLITTLFISGAFIDVVIAISLVLFLVEKRQVALSGAARVIDQLVGFSIRTGFLTRHMDGRVYCSGETCASSPHFINSQLTSRNFHYSVLQLFSVSTEWTARAKGIGERLSIRNQLNLKELLEKCTRHATTQEMRSEAIENTNERKEFWDMTTHQIHKISYIDIPAEDHGNFDHDAKPNVTCDT
ncbi:uncharacterized protein LACBIDRAFT_331459 [Laccaria bicolor S238N-H82]|uniref:Predicted protein n=1 Tax=Laccaria bicolor (strain S238N-H82 / ATCC MYA-4686) TaxID=486041 RepID=B0DPJ4_LACBS|nr:uncharacterized protein LACBIDRAFT_331459 [Laccaria bicolor S238N-H82]EDR03387.1 predicted protein [Laccaria bicolor S238N-H82]|eukprot:XP_001885843.1 predicted protein [Laccaria bicolor S238N-H82]